MAVLAKVRDKRTGIDRTMTKVSYEFNKKNYDFIQWVDEKGEKLTPKPSKPQELIQNGVSPVVESVDEVQINHEVVKEKAKRGPKPRVKEDAEI